jgi:Tryptophan-associated transmembrane protein (Trp_oprn_chp)
MDSGWRALMIIGAVLLIAAGIVVMLRATRMPVMSARYERPGRAAGASGSVGAGHRVVSQAGTGQVAAAGRPARLSTASGMWESLSAGEDPTARSE